MTTEQYPKVYLYKRMVQAKLFIDSHYSERIDLNNISDEAYLSKFHFLRLFKAVYGKTPHQYLTAIRLKNSIRLLRSGQPVSEVYHAVGFDTLSAFGSLFKRSTGVTPSAFLQQQQQMRVEMLQTPLKFIPGCFVYRLGWDEK